MRSGRSEVCPDEEKTHRLSRPSAISKVAHTVPSVPLGMFRSTRRSLRPRSSGGAPSSVAHSRGSLMSLALGSPAATLPDDEEQAAYRCDS